MLLACDIGNTNVTVGVFAGDELRASWRVATDVHKMADEYAVTLLSLMQHDGLRADDITEAILCSTVPPLVATLEAVCRRYFRVTPLVVGTGIRTGVRILYDNPREVGSDRVVDAVAAFRTFGGPVIVVDIGTAVVLDAVSREGDYLGGAIAPGMTMAAEALFAGTAKLPRIELARPKAAIGRNTVASMQSGIFYGYLSLIEGLVALFKKELGEDAKVVATGGQAELIAGETRVVDHVNPDLTLEGLRIIYDLNRTG